jgi:hypothetical protein
MSSDLPELRASHEDRDRVVENLRIAGGDGRLTAEELEGRVESALSARTLGELAALTADLPSAHAAKDVIVVEQQGGKYVRDGTWAVPARIEIRTKLCKVTLDFSEAVLPSSAVRIEADMLHGKLFIVSPPGGVIDTDGLTLTFSKAEVYSKATGTDARFRIEIVGTLRHSKVIERTH